jgi:hypothetical protein
LQNYARAHAYPIDTVSFGYEVMDHLTSGTDMAPPSGCYVRGLFLEGARWDSEAHTLGESRPKARCASWLPLAPRSDGCHETEQRCIVAAVHCTACV